MSKAIKVPVTIEIMINIIGFITLKNIKNPVRKVIKQNIRRVKRKIFNLLYLSATTPPKILSNNTGVKFALETSPSIVSESVIVLISHSLP